MRKRTNEEWLVDLLEPENNLAIADLRDHLIKGLQYVSV
jgi:hypothetical protein